MIDKVLQRIGLSDKEVAVYVASLRLGAQPLAVIAQYARINRSTAYDVFEELIKKGLAHKIPKGATTYFEVLDTSNLLRYLEREKKEMLRDYEKQQADVTQILPLLQSLENPQSKRPKVKFYEGEKGMREAYEQTFTSHEIIRGYANPEEMHKGLPGFFPEYYERRVTANLEVRAIMPDNEVSVERSKRDAIELRQSRLIPRDRYTFIPEMNIFDDKVLIASWQEQFAIIIESEEIADLHKNMYDLLWEYLSKKKSVSRKKK